MHHPVTRNELLNIIFHVLLELQRQVAQMEVTFFVVPRNNLRTRPLFSMLVLTARSRLSDASLRFRFGFHLHLNAFPQIVGWIHNDFCIFLQAIEHFEPVTEIASDANTLPMDVLLVYDGRHLWSFRTKE